MDILTKKICDEALATLPQGDVVTAINDSIEELTAWIRDFIRDKYLVPFCDEYNWKLYSSGSGFCLVKLNTGRQIRSWENALNFFYADEGLPDEYTQLKELFKLLMNTGYAAHGAQYVGDKIESYQPKQKRCDDGL